MADQSGRGCTKAFKTTFYLPKHSQVRIGGPRECQKNSAHKIAIPKISIPTFKLHQNRKQQSMEHALHDEPTTTTTTTTTTPPATLEIAKSTLTFFKQIFWFQFEYFRVKMRNSDRWKQCCRINHLVCIDEQGKWNYRWTRTHMGVHDSSVLIHQKLLLGQNENNHQTTHQHLFLWRPN